MLNGAYLLEIILWETLDVKKVISVIQLDSAHAPWSLINTGLK